MEVKEAERIVIAKPVASRPTCSHLKSFSDLIAVNACSEAAVPAIRPKTVRFKPAVNLATSSAPVSSQAELSGIGGASTTSSDKVLKPEVKRTVVYKPQAKLVSKTTVSLLANMGNFIDTNQQLLQSTEAPAQHSNQEKTNFRPQVIISPNLHHQSTPSHTEPDQTTSEPSKVGSQNMDEDFPKSLPAAAANDRPPSYDGYNWRKYGQKQVKGSEYPRSYYKCTHPNCPVKKKVERSLDGQIAEIVYKGEHNHSKPQPAKRNSAGTQVLDVTAQDNTNNSMLSSIPNEIRNENSQGRVENQNEVGLSAPSSYQGKALISSENSSGLNRECEEASKEGEDDELRNKRRKTDNQSSEVGTSGDGIQEPRVIVQSSTDSEIMGDGFRWRKYGQKVVKGNPYPRSYYRCTSIKCNVRKHVERASEDPTAFITTYEGKHNHEMPVRSSNNPVVSDPGSNSPSSKDKQNNEEVIVSEA